ncbi:MAG: hypothetical protein K8F62_05615, partial [Pseudorhodoplanes sp.]|nr:hypothetical protein [Pseudorhodoplanes sp.]
LCLQAPTLTTFGATSFQRDRLASWRHNTAATAEKVEKAVHSFVGIAQPPNNFGRILRQIRFQFTSIKGDFCLAATSFIGKSVENDSIVAPKARSGCAKCHHNVLNRRAVFICPGPVLPFRAYVEIPRICCIQRRCQKVDFEAPRALSA